MTEKREGPLGQSDRIRAAGLANSAGTLSAREADRALLALTSETTLDTTHFDTVRFPPPPWAAQRFAEAASNGELAYTTYQGSSQIRRMLAVPLSDWLGMPVDGDDNIMLTPGTQAGLFSVLSSIVDPGQHVALTDPDYLFNERILTFLGAQISRVPLTQRGGDLVPDLSALERAFQDGARLFVFSHPNNPTGAVFPREVLLGIATLAVQYDATVLVDELYGRLTYDDEPFVHLASLPGMRERTITLLGPSKTESLSGYRVGVVVAPKHLVGAAEDVLSITALRAPAYAQHVLKGWLTQDVAWVADRVEQLRGLRELTLTRLSELSWIGLAPQRGTAYLFPDVSALGVADSVVAESLARRADVLISPGYQFGPAGTGHFRVCYARDEQIWDRALHRIVDVLDDMYTQRPSQQISQNIHQQIGQNT